MTQMKQTGVYDVLMYYYQRFEDTTFRIDQACLVPAERIRTIAV